MFLQGKRFLRVTLNSIQGPVRSLICYREIRVPNQVRDDGFPDYPPDATKALNILRLIAQDEFLYFAGRRFGKL